jgi:polyhydroxybutyrate depolymerase
VVPDWLDRSFELTVPPAWDGHSALPVIVLLHGGGGSRQTSNKSTCKGGDETSASCLVASAGMRGYAVVIPDGTGQRPLRNIRTWNGGGGNELQCTSGPACKSRVDDIRYFGDLMAQVRGTIPVDDRRIYATGISNGGAMSHRLACELPDQIAAIVGVSGANEFADDGGPCDVRVPVRQIHGTADPCWGFMGGAGACLQDDGRAKTSVATTMEGWRTRNGCAQTPIDTPRGERDPADGTSLTVRLWQGCTAATELLIVNGGGHTWPSGNPYADEDKVGLVSFEVDNADILDFFDAHVHP